MRTENRIAVSRRGYPRRSSISFVCYGSKRFCALSSLDRKSAGAARRQLAAGHSGGGTPSEEIRKDKGSITMTDVHYVVWFSAGFSSVPHRFLDHAQAVAFSRSRWPGLGVVVMTVPCDGRDIEAVVRHNGSDVRCSDLEPLDPGEIDGAYIAWCDCGADDSNYLHNCTDCSSPDDDPSTDIPF